MKLKEGDIVVCKWGKNPITNRPYEFLYDFGYKNKFGGVVVYTHGERNMQDAHCFDKHNVRKADSEDINYYNWGT